eukprot:2451663-Alexandrium_andersonii.AAC.1
MATALAAAGLGLTLRPAKVAYTSSASGLSTYGGDWSAHPTGAGVRRGDLSALPPPPFAARAA